MSVMLSHLLSVGFFADHTLVGAESALRTVVGSVVAAATPRALADAAPAALVVFPRAALHAEDVGTDLAIRAGAQRSVAGLVLQRPPHPLPLSTRALAEKSGVPLVLVDHVETDRLVPAMDRYVRTPDTSGTGPLGLIAHRLRAAGTDPEQMLHVVSATLHHPVGLVDPTGRVLAGDVAPDVPRSVPDARARLRAARPAPWVRAAGEELLVAQPVQLTPAGPANLWLVAVVPAGDSTRAHTAALSLGVLAWAFTAHLATTAVEFERRGRRQEVLLDRLVDEAEAPRRRVLERATALGWRLAGTHTAVHVTTRRSSATAHPAVVGGLLRDCLVEHGIGVDPIAHRPGWSLWTTAPDGAPDTTALLRRVRAALLAVEREHPGLRLCAGVGTPGEGVPGLRRSLEEARQASLVAAARDTEGAVEQLGEDNVKRLLADRFTTGVQHELAAQLLRPLLTADAGGQLVLTLACYLDNESSATATAGALGVHRNTVLQRLDRIRSLLSVEFSDPDVRLALHLAVRLVQVGSPEADRARQAG
ncbi:PucR family transcriptional regulator [Actinokineospora bangkokensis]|uniref:PucR C-terminal helix-turn-helix domain-containing protein n=1 Tax=Actinokineospora bangkokensis TaxID=1193682 RepID=A0A1Q9LK62_9PSEU|nr:helix-turn-helix domain-containing protein [Actinokineospora bangkokensis]OLR92384.1 hypothetical protein BJP25_20060 [Actinokineospora bangkokensis]